MSDLTPKDPRLEQAGASDESLQAAHEKLLGRKPDDGAHYKMLPLVLLLRRKKGGAAPPPAAAME